MQRIVKTNQDVIGEQRRKNDGGVLVSNDEVKKIDWKSYNEKLSSTEFAWNGNIFSHADTVSNIPCLTDKDMVREAISKMKNGKVAGPSDVVPDMVKAAGEAKVDMIIELVNQIIVELVLPSECEPSFIVNYYKRKRDSLERINYRGQKLSDQIVNLRIQQNGHR